MLRVGETAPPFEAPVSGGGRVRLADLLAAGPVVLSFYPRDFTPGCTRQVCVLRDGFARFREAGAAVYGVSSDPVDAHDAFVAAHALPFPLISDADHAIARAYRVLWFGLPFPRRVTYLIDRGGSIRLAAHHELFIGRHAADVAAALGRIQEEGGRSGRR